MEEQATQAAEQPIETPSEPAAEETVEAAAPAEAPEPPEEEEEEQEGEPRQNLLDLKKPRGQRIYGAYKAFKAMTEALGFEPTVDQLRAYVERFNDTEAMEADFNSPNPADVENFALNWNEKSPQGMVNFAAILPDFLARHNAAAYAQMARPVILRYANALYERAQDPTLDENLRKALLGTAQTIELDFTGRYRTADAPRDPLSDRERALEAKEAQIRAWEQQQQQARIDRYRSEVNRSIDEELGKRIEEALAPIKTQLQSHPTIYRAVRNDFLNEIRSKVSSNSEGMRQLSLRFERSALRPTETDKNDLVRLYASMADSVIKALAPRYIREASFALKAEADRAHETHGRAAANVMPASAGAPKPTLPKLPQGASASEALSAKIDALLGIS